MPGFQLAKPAIVTIATEAMAGKHVENIVADFELGNIPQLDNTSAQMALVEIAEELKGSIFIEKVLTEDNVSQFGKLQSLGIRAFCETVSNNPVNIAVIEDMVTPKLFESTLTDKHVANISKLIESREKELITPVEEVQLNNIHDFKRYVQKIKKIGRAHV